MIQKNKKLVVVAAVLSVFGSMGAFAKGETVSSRVRFIQVKAQTKEERSAIADFGVSIEAIKSDSIWGFATEKEISELEADGYSVLGNFPPEIARGRNDGFGFPPQDSEYHDYRATVALLRDLNSKNADIMRIVSIGKSVEGRDIWAVHINTTPGDLMSGTSGKPGAIFMGNHHAREHLSNEIPLLFAKYLLEKRRAPNVSALLDSRDIWIIPMVNPDGAEFDISTGNYQFWRKNRSVNGDGTFGVDLNRNYGYDWGTGGSSNETDSEVYMGPAPFSEPETRAIRDFVNAHLNATVLLTFHSFSELILYPWGHTYDPITKEKDHAVFEKMATTMAAWNHYTPEQSSALYIASGDTTDWAYGEHGIFAFTFELSPNRDAGMVGFYPGNSMIDQAFQDNLKPCMYLLKVAKNPYGVLDGAPTGLLKNYVQPHAGDWLRAQGLE